VLGGHQKGRKTMPNHVLNLINVDAMHLADLRAKMHGGTVDGEEILVDFNKIVPEPEGIHDLPCNDGIPEWYLWRCNNWGTKWNAYAFDYTPTGVTYLTAWEPSTPYVLALSKHLLDVDINLAWADEDIGSDNHGIATFRNGEITYYELKDKLFACDLMGLTADLIEFEEMENE
jgi:hypothetical protein